MTVNELIKALQEVPQDAQAQVESIPSLTSLYTEGKRRLIAQVETEAHAVVLKYYKSKRDEARMCHTLQPPPRRVKGKMKVADLRAVLDTYEGNDEVNANLIITEGVEGDRHEG